MIRISCRLGVLALVFAAFAACDNDDETPGLRRSISYTSLDTAIAYSDQFLDENDNTTVDLISGNTLHKMFQGLNYQITSSVSSEVAITAQNLEDLFTNSGDPFADVNTNTVSITGAELNSSGLNLEDHVASSGSSENATVHTYMSDLFSDIATASLSAGQTAEKGVPGKLGNYLVDANGIELAQVIQKSLIGALQLDYIGNVLLGEGLNANNTTLVEEQNYTQLEHNWDVAYGLLTLNPVYLRGATDSKRKTTEFGAGAYIWEYNKGSYARIYESFLKGRAAIVNNDRTELEKQAMFIRTEFEKALANAALGYLGKWKSPDGATEAEQEARRAHAFGEGLGFIYALRFANVHGADAEFSDHIIEELTSSEFGYWDVTVSQINHAGDEIREKFNL